VESQTADATCLHIAVTDTGIGFPRTNSGASSSPLPKRTVPPPASTAARAWVSRSPSNSSN
jgi:hypothetical protein